MFRGGQWFVYAGEVVSSSLKPDEKTGELKASVTVSYWGGSEYLRLDDPDQYGLVKNEGARVVILAQVRSFGERTYASNARVLEVNGQKVQGESFPTTKDEPEKSGKAA